MRIDPPLSGEDRLDRWLIEIYEKQKNLTTEQFLFGRMIGDFFFIATHTYDVNKKKLTRSRYPKIWASILRYVCELWRTRCTIFQNSKENTEKEKSLQAASSLLNSEDISFILMGDKSLLTKTPHNGWKIHLIQAWIQTITSSIAAVKRYAMKNETTLAAFLSK